MEFVYNEHKALQRHARTGRNRSLNGFGDSLEKLRLAVGKLWIHISPHRHLDEQGRRLVLNGTREGVASRAAMVSFLCGGGQSACAKD